MFKRRNRRSLSLAVREFFYPRGGFWRATQYVIHRMRRLPDEPHRIARGVFAGTFVNFPPIFGFQFVSAALIAWAIRGNILAALLMTFLSNPITTPLIAVRSMELGYWMLGMDQHLDFMSVFAGFADAGSELWRNFKAIFTREPTHWKDLGEFFQTIYLPYLVGSIIPGIVFSLFAYYISIPLVGGFQKLRRNRTLRLIEKRRALKALIAEADARAAARAEGGPEKPGDDEGG